MYARVISLLTIATDADKLLDLIGSVQGLLEIESLIDGMIDACARNFDCDFVSINEIGPDAEHVVSVVKPELPRELYTKFGQYAHQNPLLAHYLETLDGRAIQFTDVIGTEDLHALDLYKEIYGVIGVEHQMSFMLQAPPRSVLALVLSSDTAFTEDERRLANDARPFFIQAWTNAIRYTALSDALAAQVVGGSDADRRLIAELSDRGLTARQAEVVVLTARGRSNRDSAEALGISERTVQKHLERSYRVLEVSGRSAAAALVWSLVSEYPEPPSPQRRGLDGHEPA